MSGLCGWFGEPGDPGVLDSMACMLARHDGSRPAALLGERAAIAAAALGGAADVDRSDGLLVAVSGALRFDDRQLAQLAAQRGGAAAVAEAYRTLGKGLLQTTHGAFSVAILDETRNIALLAIDRAGAGALAYTVAGSTLVFGSSADAIRLHPSVAAAVDPQALYNYVYFHMVPGPGTIYSGIRRLMPGEYLLFENGRAAVGTYWQMRFVESERRPFEALKTEFIEALRQSVRDAAGGGVVGCFLSGGTDSSTVAGLLGEVTGAPARTYSIGFDAQGYDEMEFARIAARRFATDHHEYYVTPDDVVAAIPKIAAVYDQPFGNSSAVPTYYCARLARTDGVDTLLGGDGGDELFGGNARYAKQRIYSYYSDLPSAVRKGIVEPLAFMVRTEAGPLGRAQRFVRHASEPMPARYDNYNLLERLGPEKVFTSDFLASVDRGAPLALMEDIWRNARAQTLINRMLAMDLRFTLADNDLPKVSRTCELAQVGIRFPMLDDRVVSFSASLAPELKLKGTRLRHFFKEALRGFLPDEIISKKKHGFGLPFGPWLRTHAPLRALAYDSLASLKRRGIVQPRFIDELTGTHVESHAGYYGTMVWVLMMLEGWYAHSARP